MSTTAIIVTVLIAIGVVALLVLGLSITLIRKGHHIEGDVGGNREMKRRGLECVTAQIRREEAERLGKAYPPENELCDGSCAGCSPQPDCDEKVNVGLKLKKFY